MIESENEVSRMDQLENSLAKITEQLQALTIAMVKMIVPSTGENSGNVRREEPPNGLVIGVLTHGFYTQAHVSFK